MICGPYSHDDVGSERTPSRLILIKLTKEDINNRLVIETNKILKRKKKKNYEMLANAVNCFFPPSRVHSMRIELQAA